jgi:murein DD-endopeptidase MepM/ murein hydrolase activator NlpD
MRRALRTRLFGGKKLTFLYVPDNASVRQFMVPKVVFYALAGAAFMGLGLIAFFGSRYLSAAAEGRQLLTVRGENLQLRQHLREVQNLIDSYKEEMQASIGVQQKLRLVANLEQLDPEVLEAGVGGPAPLLGGNESMSFEARVDVETAVRDLGQLLRQAKMQRDSYREILTVVEERRANLDRTPSVRPVAYCTITSRFGRRVDPFTGQPASHRGVDFAAYPGSPVRATADGVIRGASRYGGYGLMVEIDHGNGLVSRYAHCSAILVKRGQSVKRGQTIARVGSSGRASGSHVHYEVLRNGLQVDPMGFVLPTDVVVD